MIKKSIILPAVGILCSLLLFQNCGDGFQSNSGDSNLFSSQEFGDVFDPTPFVNCQEHTTFIACDQSTVIPDGFLPNGCPIASCDGTTTGGDGGDSCSVPPTAEAQIGAIYQRWFSRTPDDAGLCYHYGELQGHGSLGQLELNILAGMQQMDLSTVNSDSTRRSEAINFTSENGNFIHEGLLGAQERKVVAIFQKYFGRTPLFPGLDFWANQSMNDVDLEYGLVIGAGDEDKVRLNSSAGAQLFRTFCASNGGLEVPTWVQ